MISAFNLRSQELIQNKTETKVEFKIKNLGMYVSGNFSDYNFTGNFSSENIKESKLSVVIKVNSLSTKNKKRDAHLSKEEYFDVEHFKEIKFVSTKIEKTSANTYNLTGELTIKNITKTVVLPAEIIENKDSILIKSNFDINRRTYGVGGNVWILSNTVKAKVILSAKKLAS
jgi:polyisoprenoid-binding protein YceI